MEKVYVAKSYQDMEQIDVPFVKENGKRYILVKGKCKRCGGSGNYSYNPLDGTRCYGCGGSGKVIIPVRAYTQKEYENLERAAERARLKKEAEKAAKAKDLIDNANKYKHEIALKLGFGENEKAYLIYGDDTYSIKTKLKELGARFDPTLKWYLSTPVDLPEGFKLCEFSFDELYDYIPEQKFAQFKENAKQIVSRRIAELRGPSTSKFYPEPEKSRIRDITAKVSNIRGFEGAYGYTNVYTFTSQDYVFIWMTAKSFLNLAIGDTVDLTGTIKKFDEYMGEKQTHLTRCVVTKVGE